MRRTGAFAFCMAVTLAWCAAPLATRAQQACEAPSTLPTAPGSERITSQQEADIGDVFAEHMQRNFHVIEDDELTGYLSRTGNRVLQQLPGAHPAIQFVVVDLPIPNAFSLPGRVYVTRKMIGFLRNEDELAALLGHEMGHILSHQSAVSVAGLFQKVLGVKELGDRREIFENYNRLIDSAARNPKAFEHVQREDAPYQAQADRIGMIALVDADYSAQSMADMFDRYAQTKGKTGNWITDLFGGTRPEELRLREMRKSLAALPPGCRQKPPSPPSEAFLNWQLAVTTYAGLGRKEALRAVVEKKLLNPPLRSDLTHLRFSPDGQRVLAQDETSIFVLTRYPFAVQFRIEAPEAREAQFTPDGAAIVFHTSALRVERWSLAEEKREAVHELVVREGCTQSQLSPDGTVLACMNHEYELSLLDVATGNAFFSKKPIFEPSSFFELLASYLNAFFVNEAPEWVHMGFSPDGKYFLAARHGTTLAMDMSTRTKVSLHGGLNQGVGRGFTFLGPDRVVGINDTEPRKSAVMSFPGGEKLQEVALGETRLEAAAHGNVVMVRPLKNAPMGMLDLATQKMLITTTKSAAGDLYDQYFLSETAAGDVGLYELPGKFVIAAALPQSRLGSLYALALSPDLKWLALSGKTRGAVWNLEKNARLYYVLGFKGAYFDGERAIYVDFPKEGNTGRGIGRGSLSGQGWQTAVPIEEKEVTRQYGRFLVTRRPKGKDQDWYRNVTVDVRDVRDGKTLWTRDFPKEAPSIHFGGAGNEMVIEWALDSGEAKDEIKSDAGLARIVSGMKDTKRSYLLDEVEATTGKQLGRVVVDTSKGAYRIASIEAYGEWLLVTDTQNRTHLYSVPQQKETGTFFGSHSTLSREAGLLCVENEPGQMAFYELKTGEKRGQVSFSNPVSYAQFSGDGKRLMVLTSNQMVYILDAGQLATTPPASTKGF